MLKKIIKYTLRALLVVLVVLILVPALLYIRPYRISFGSARSAMPRGRSGWICPSNVSGSPFRSGCR